MASHGSRSPFGFSLFNISLVLFFLGIFFLLAFTFHSVVQRSKENLEMDIILEHQVSAEKGQALAQQMNQQYFTQSARYESKEEALENYADQTGDQFIKTMDGVNPMPASVKVKLAPAYRNPDSVQKISLNLLQVKRSMIHEVKYPINLVEKVDRNSKVITTIALILGVALTLITLLIIMNTVRLAIFSRRLLIRSMQLVGATAQFIRRPFLRIGFLQGLIAGVIASGLLAAFIYLVDRYSRVFDLQFLLFDPMIHVFLGALVIFGGVIGLLSSYLAVNRFLHRKLEDII
jgi:cell division transport system permease protein